jgi:hypothetical protein
MVPFMGQITIRGVSVDLPALDEGSELDRISSPGDLTGLVSDFEFSGVRVPVLELKDVTLAAGRIGKVRAGETSLTGAHVRSVEFAGCELGSLRWTGGKISLTRRPANGCSAHDHVIVCIYHAFSGGSRVFRRLQSTVVGPVKAEARGACVATESGGLSSGGLSGAARCDRGALSSGERFGVAPRTPGVSRGSGAPYRAWAQPVQCSIDPAITGSMFHRAGCCQPTGVG